jgi:hypothetical protein
MQKKTLTSMSSSRFPSAVESLIAWNLNIFFDDCDCDIALASETLRELVAILVGTSVTVNALSIYCTL